MIARDDGVQLEGLTSETVCALFVCDRIYRQHGIEAVITSARDSHSDGLHPEGKAFDLRLPSRLVFERIFEEPWDRKKRDLDERIWVELIVALGQEFDVILERHQTNPWVWHIHVEHDPD